MIVGNVGQHSLQFAWGIRNRRKRRQCGLRFTPTRVGNTNARSVHPHTRGEYGVAHHRSIATDDVAIDSVFQAVACGVAHQIMVGRGHCAVDVRGVACSVAGNDGVGEVEDARVPAKAVAIVGGTDVNPTCGVRSRSISGTCRPTKKNASFSYPSETTSSPQPRRQDPCLSRPRARDPALGRGAG